VFVFFLGFSGELFGDGLGVGFLEVDFAFVALIGDTVWDVLASRVISR
jgi:hypothetical protein